MKRLDSGVHPSEAELLFAFQKGPEEFGPVGLWWWSGDRLTKARMTDQLERMASGGLRNLMIVNLAPCGTIYGCAPDDPPFLSEPWWAIFGHFIEETKRLGIRAWFYDQLGFSGASLQAELVTRNPAFQGVQLCRAAQDLEGPTTATLPVPALGTPIAAFTARIVDRASLPDDPCAVGDALREVRDVTDRIRDGLLTVEVPDGRHRVMIFATVAAGFDYQNPEACAVLIDRVHGAIEQRFGSDLGTHIIGSFQDEFPALPRFSGRLPEEFRARTGYDLIAHLPALFDDVTDRFGGADGPTAAQVRCDAARVAEQLCEESFFIPLDAWHQRHDMLCGYDQTIRDADPIRGDNYYIDYFRTMRHFSAPGNEQMGSVKPHQSIADLYGKPRVWMEGYHSSGWGQTLEDIATLLHPWMVDGSTLYHPHAIYYSSHGSFWEWAPPDNGWRQPYFAHYPAMAHYVSRLCYLLTRGDRVVRDAVLHPASTVHSCCGWGEDGEDAKQANRLYWDYLKAMGQARHDCIILDEESLQRAEVRDGSLCIRSMQLRSVTLPSCRALEGASLARLVEFSDAGGRLIVMGEAPAQPADGAMPEGEFRRLAEKLAARATRLSHAEEAVRELRDRPEAAANGEALPCLVRRVGERRFYFLLSDATISASIQALREVNHFDRSATAAGQGQCLPITLSGCGIPEIWSARTGEVVPVLNFRRDIENGTTRVDVDLSDTPAPMLALRPAAESDPLAIESTLRIVSCERDAEGLHIVGETRFNETAESTACPVRVEYADATFEAVIPVSPPRIMELAGPFDCRLEKTCANDDGSFAWPPSNGPIPVERRVFRFREETDGETCFDGADPDWDDEQWESVLASFGPRAEWSGPVALESGKNLYDSNPGRFGDMPWKPCVYSEKLGIENDRVFASGLGGKGRISEEFIDLGDGNPGEVYRIRTVIHAPEALRGVLLRIGGPVRKRAFLNGAKVLFPSPRNRQKMAAPVDLNAGPNRFEMLIEREKPGPLRCFHHILPLSAAPVDPEWIWYPGRRRTGTVRMAKVFDLPEAVESAQVAVALANLRHRVRVNGAVVGERGGFDPYFTSRADRYDIAAHLRKGSNRFEVDIVYPGDPIGEARDWPVGLLVDGLITLSGGSAITLASDSTFTAVGVEANGAPQGNEEEVDVLLGPLNDYFGDLANLLAYPRPHPLRLGGWLQDQSAPASPVGSLVYARPGSDPRPSWYRFLLPPGATAMRWGAHGKSRLFVEGEEVAVRETGERAEDGGALCSAALPGADLPRRRAALRIRPEIGHEKGAAISSPVTFEVGSGRIPLGSWDELGLPHYSGGMIYSVAVALDAAPTGPVWLDLGRVRGSADVEVNGIPCGVRLWHPYRFDIAEAVRPGENHIAIRVFNTLGPHYGIGHPSAYVFENHNVSGIMGPIRIALCDRVRASLEEI